MSRIIAVMNPKDGVGKTTTALNLAQAFALGGQGALLIDFDLGDGVSRHLGVAQPRSGLLGRILAGEEDPTSIGLLVRSVVAGLDVVPSDVTSSDAEPGDGAGAKLAEALHVLRFQYPWCIVDCPSTMCGWARAAVEVADTIVIPIEAELFARESTAEILEFIDKAKESAKLTHDIRILMTRFRDKNSLSADVRRDLSFEYPRRLSPTVVPHDKAVVESRQEGRPLLQYSLESRASRAYVQFAKELMKHERTEAR